MAKAKKKKSKVKAKTKTKAKKRSKTVVKKAKAKKTKTKAKKTKTKAKTKAKKTKTMAKAKVKSKVNPVKGEAKFPKGMPKVGDSVPAFKMEATGGKKISPKDFSGKKNIVVYFYPKDNTPGCTKEACDFRDNFRAFSKKNSVILGVSPDNLKSHDKFIDKFDLPFELITDPDHVLAEKFGTWVEKNMYGRKYMGVQRSTFLVNKKGKIVAAWPKVAVKDHASEVLATIDELAK